MSSKRKLKVFLCHSRDDKPKVRELCRRLINDRFDAWLDEERLIPGQEWDLEIRKAVRQADTVVVCLSNKSITKEGYVQKEIRLALDIADEKPEGTIFLIPTKLEECQVPSRLSKWQWVDFFDENGYRKLKLSLVLRAQNLEIDTFAARHFNFEPYMIRIPMGKFLMGSTQEQAKQAIHEGLNEDWAQDEQSQHEVELSEYFIGRYPITNEQYQFFITETGYKPPTDWLHSAIPALKEQYPVVNVSWEDTMEYCRWLSDQTGKPYRLPTEAEWEKAARGVDGRVYPWGRYFRREYSTDRKSDGGLTPVGQFSPETDSPYGCADMLGNVLQWCLDWYNTNEYKLHDSMVRDPKGPPNGTTKVIRGGIYTLGPWSMRCAFRSGSKPYVLSDVGGFRVALS
jgi:formylglycine-generating enzyme required for sulfatase activity